MIKPISIKNPCVLENIYNKQDRDSCKNVCVSNDLANYKEALVYKSQLGIIFKNKFKVEDVTNLYNKKVAGKEYLDLPMIKVYNFPNTNLQLFVNLDNQIKQNEQSAIFFIQEKNSGRVKNQILKYILEKKIPNNVQNGSVNTDGSGISYHLSYDFDFFNNIAKLNKIVTNLDIKAEDFEQAKEKFKNYLNSEEYQNSVKIPSALYEQKQIKSDKEIIQEIDNLTIDDMKEYYLELKKNSSIQGYLTVNSSDFSKNRLKYLNDINSSINGKFCVVESRTDNLAEFELNKKVKVIKNPNIDNINIYFPIKYENAKDSIMSHVATCLLNEKFEDIDVKKETFLNPVGVDEIKCRKHDNVFLNFKFEKDIKYKDLYSTVNKIINSDISSTLEEIKLYQKQRVDKIFNEDNLSEIKTFEMFLQDVDLFTIYETIDSITEQDVKEYIKTYFIDQKPIVERKG